MLSEDGHTAAELVLDGFWSRGAWISAGVYDHDAVLAAGEGRQLSEEANLVM